MMRLIRLGAALTVILATVSCARPEAVGGGGQPSAEVTSHVLPTPPSLGPSDLPPAMRPNVATPDSRVTDLKPVRWTQVVASAGSQVEVRYTITGRGDCAKLGRVDVTESTREVTITVLVGRLPGTDCGGIQPQLAAVMTTMVTLAAPLGSRQVRDGAAR
jgi:hypothetical protein